MPRTFAHWIDFDSAPTLVEPHLIGTAPLTRPRVPFAHHDVRGATPSPSLPAGFRPAHGVGSGFDGIAVRNAGIAGDRSWRTSR